MARPKRDVTRITINVPTQLLKLVDRYAEINCITRTTAIMLLLSDALASVSFDKEE